MDQQALHIFRQNSYTPKIHWLHLATRMLEKRWQATQRLVPSSTQSLRPRLNQSASVWSTNFAFNPLLVFEDFWNEPLNKYTYSIYSIPLILTQGNLSTESTRKYMWCPILSPSQGFQNLIFPKLCCPYLCIIESQPHLELEKANLAKLWGGLLDA